MKMKRWLLCVMILVSVLFPWAMGARPSYMVYGRTSRNNGGHRPTNTKYGHGREEQKNFRVARPPPSEWIGGRYGAEKRRVPTGSNPLHNRSYIHKATPRHRC